MIRAEKIRVDTDEGRYVLLIDTDEGEKLAVDIHDDVLDFYASVRAEIRPYVIESDHARATMVQYGQDEEHDMTQAYHEHGDLFRDIARGK
jgi:hypothetical protein